jgi:hypothetical protein
MARIEVEYAGYRHRQVVVDPETPPEFEARLVLDGYDDVEASLVMLLEGDLRAPARSHPIVPVRSDADWDAYARLKRLDWAERAARLGWVRCRTSARAHHCYRKKVPRFATGSCSRRRAARLLLVVGRHGRRRPGRGSLRREGVSPPRPRDGALQHTVADARAAGAGPIAIIADATDTPKAMYAAMASAQSRPCGSTHGTCKPPTERGAAAIRATPAAIGQDLRAKRLLRGSERPCTS